MLFLAWTLAHDSGAFSGRWPRTLFAPQRTASRGSTWPISSKSWLILKRPALALERCTPADASPSTTRGALRRDLRTLARAALPLARAALRGACAGGRLHGAEDRRMRLDMGPSTSKALRLSAAISSIPSSPASRPPRYCVPELLLRECSVFTVAKCRRSGGWTLSPQALRPATGTRWATPHRSAAAPATPWRCHAPGRGPTAPIK
jgi:hypothetical protein